MYILKNAWISIMRNKGRNVLIGIIVLVISCVTTISLAIVNSSNSLIESYQEQYEIIATIGINRENMRSEMKFDRNSESDEEIEEKKDNMNDIFANASNISVEDIEKYGDSDYVKSYYYTMSIGVNSDDIEKASLISSDSNNGMMDDLGGRGDKKNFTNMDSSDFTLLGYSSIDSMEEFISGKYSITEGKVLLDGSSCIINSELALLNNISVGDEITFVDINEEESITLEVVGIYEETSNDTSNQMGMFTSSVNTIITSTNAVNDFVEDNDDISVTITPTFILTGKDVIENFEEELQEKGLSEYLALSTNLDQAENATSTISNVANFASTFLFLTLLIGAIVLFVINMINIRERKYEIGVLRTIGMKKILLSLQFMTELLIVSIFALLIGAGIGASLSVNVSNKLLENEISSSSEQKDEVNKNFGEMNDKGFDKVSGIVEVQAYDSINAVVDAKVLIELIGIGILLTIISSSCTMISIQRFSPLSILKERS